MSTSVRSVAVVIVVLVGAVISIPNALSINIFRWFAALNLGPELGPAWAAIAMFIFWFGIDVFVMRFIVEKDSYTTQWLGFTVGSTAGWPLFVFGVTTWLTSNTPTAGTFDPGWQAIAFIAGYALAWGNQVKDIWKGQTTLSEALAKPSQIYYLVVFGYVLYLVIGSAPIIWESALPLARQAALIGLAIGVFTIALDLIGIKIYPRTRTPQHRGEAN